jgi:hypothetical protein
MRDNIYPLDKSTTHTIHLKSPENSVPLAKTITRGVSRASLTLLQSTATDITNINFALARNMTARQDTNTRTAPG